MQNAPVRTGRAVRSDDGGQSKIQIEGALDALSVRDIHPTMDAVVADHPQRVTVDLDHVTLIDSTGVGAIVSLFKRVTAQGGQVVVVSAHDQPLAVLKLLKLDTVFGL
jgi:anti-sigma B factor antagonist